MALDLNVYKAFLFTVIKDSRITVWHMAALLGIIQLAKDNDISAPIYISRKKVMELSHINNFVTYHKCIKELQELGYIQYFPSYHPGIQTKILLLKIL